MNKIRVGQDLYELNVDEKLRPSIERNISGRTQMDIEIDTLNIPNNPFFLNKLIVLLRWYRKSLSRKIGHRCVFDPSCSRYCEIAIRNQGILRGLYLTFNRLLRCRPKNGGVDLPKGGIS